MIISPQVVQDLQAQFNMDFQEAFGKRKNLWMEKAYRANSTSYKTVFHWLAEQPEMRKWVGARVYNNLISRAYELKNEDWEYTFTVDKNDVFYDNLGAYEDRGRVAGDVGGRWYDKVVTDAQIAGNTTVCWDGQFFYDTDHPVVFDDAGAGTYSNSLSTKPLTADNVWEACATMMAYKGENGVPMEIVPGVLEVPPQLGKKAFEAVSAPISTAVVKNVAGTENVAAAGISNVLPDLLNSIQGALKVVINPRLASQAQVYYIHSVDRIKPFVMQVALDPTGLVQITDPTHPEVFNGKRFVFGTEAKGAAAGTLPFLSIRVSEV